MLLFNLEVEVVSEVAKEVSLSVGDMAVCVVSGINWEVTVDVSVVVGKLLVEISVIVGKYLPEYNFEVMWLLM